MCRASPNMYRRSGRSSSTKPVLANCNKLLPMGSPTSGFLGPILNSVKRTAALWYLNRLLTDVELCYLLPNLKTYWEKSALQPVTPQDFPDRATSDRQRRLSHPISFSV